MAKGPLNDDQLQEYQANGFVLVRRMFDEEETGLLRRAAKEDRELDQHSYGRGDGEGGTVRLSLWNHPGDTLYGMFARSESIVNSAEKLLGGEVYHYHSKIVVTPETVVRWHRAGFSSSNVGLGRRREHASCIQLGYWLWCRLLKGDGVVQGTVRGLQANRACDVARVLVYRLDVAEGKGVDPGLRNDHRSRGGGSASHIAPDSGRPAASKPDLKCHLIGLDL
jgi:hypothetical protein